MDELQAVGTESTSPVITNDSNKTETDGQAFASLLERAGGSGAGDGDSPPLVDTASDLDESSANQSGGLPLRKELTPEEERRLQWLQDQLQQCLLSLAENPSEQTRWRIRELEKEIAELTGVEMKSSLSKTAKNLTKLDPEAKDEDEQRGKKMPGDLAMELGVNPLPIDRVETGVDKGAPNIMNFYQQNLGAFLAVGRMGDLS